MYYQPIDIKENIMSTKRLANIIVGDIVFKIMFLKSGFKVQYGNNYEIFNNLKDAQKFFDEMVLIFVKNHTKDLVKKFLPEPSIKKHHKKYKSNTINNVQYKHNENLYNLTYEQAFEAMKAGHKVQNENFTSTEFFEIKGRYMVDEQGYPMLGWFTGAAWQLTGWKIIE